MANKVVKSVSMLTVVSSLHLVPLPNIKQLPGSLRCVAMFLHGQSACKTPLATAPFLVEQETPAAFLVLQDLAENLSPLELNLPGTATANEVLLTHALYLALTTPQQNLLVLLSALVFKIQLHETIQPIVFTMALPLLLTRSESLLPEQDPEKLLPYSIPPTPVSMEVEELLVC